jgi:ADP-ribose pyrophosphatase
MATKQASHELIAREILFEGRIITVRRDQVRMPDGDAVFREVAETSDAVAVVALDDAGEVFLLRQYRYPIGRYVLEIPAGRLDVDGESPEAAARRELSEEAGLVSSQWAFLANTLSSPGFASESIAIYLAEQACPGGADDFIARHEEADIEIIRMPLAAAIEQLSSDAYTDAKTLVGLLLAERRMAE